MNMNPDSGRAMNWCDAVSYDVCVASDVVDMDDADEDETMPIVLDVDGSCVLNNFDDVDAIVNCEYYMPNNISHYFVFCELIDFLNVSANNNSNLFLLHINVRSLTAHADDLALLINGFQLYINIPQIVALSETWLNDDTNYGPILSYFPCHSLVAKNRVGKRGGGTGFLIDKNLAYENLNCNFSLSSDLFEWVGIKFASNNKKNIIICIYRPPNYKLDNFLSKMQEFLYELLRDDVSSDVFILGDFNIDLAVKNQASLSFLNLMAQFNLHPIINQPTRITSSHSSTIDNVFTNYGIGGCPKGILYSDVSDHLPIFLCIPLNAKAVGGKNPYIKTRLINSENLKKANCLLQNIQWNMSDYWSDFESDFESNFKKFLKTYLNCINLALPLVNKKNRFRRPWMNIDLYNLSLYKNVLYKRHLHNPSPANKNAYNKVKNKFINVKRFTEKKYFENKLKNQPGTKHRWRIINEILGSKKSCNKLFSNDASETAKLSTVTGLNKFFVEIGKNINKILGDGQLISNVGPYVVSNNPIFIPRDTTPDEIVSVITSATRQHGMLMPKKVRTSTYDRSWVAKGVRLWNALAMHNQLQLTIEHFKHYAKSEVMSMSVDV
ncbi:hypothetical protein HELRODRAFT_171831 [Helobdella robusta]|uniref:Endonuclease/exonuclease/phosphatase domain-containing protein n=1 Tax=Helobdella robusta TaxID=6412 RepID=T1F4R4_HELRO|nr:hypothetical protein HELRODRAFT_171831 [Helobdella robusta]ESO05429.1 hypothetical protein HELRODRAFT_171831 [Helobdella robusta]